MLRKSGLQIFALALIMVLSDTDLMAQKRISFRRGVTVRRRSLLAKLCNTH